MITYYAEISRNADSKTESSHSKISCKKDVLKHSLKSYEGYSIGVNFFSNVDTKKELQHGSFSMKIAKTSGTAVM